MGETQQCEILQQAMFHSHRIVAKRSFFCSERVGIEGMVMKMEIVDTQRGKMSVGEIGNLR